MTDAQLAAIRELFPVTRGYVYLNHASNGPLAVSAVRAMNCYIERCSFDGEVPMPRLKRSMSTSSPGAARRLPLMQRSGGRTSSSPRRQASAASTDSRGRILFVPRNSGPTALEPGAIAAVSPRLDNRRRPSILSARSKGEDQ